MAISRILRTPGRRGAAQPPRSRAFILELLLNMLIFALCAVVALQVFVEGKLTSDESAALTKLTLEAQTIAEEFKASDSEFEVVAQAHEYGVQNPDGSTSYYYDSNLEPSGTETASYRLIVMQASAQDDPVKRIEIAGYDGDRELLNFEVTRYQAREGG